MLSLDQGLLYTTERAHTTTVKKYVNFHIDSEILTIFARLESSIFDRLIPLHMILIANFCKFTIREKINLVTCEDCLIHHQKD